MYVLYNVFLNLVGIKAQMDGEEKNKREIINGFLIIFFFKKIHISV